MELRPHPDKTRRPWDPQLEALREEVDRLRDQLRVQAHLAGKEASEGFRGLEMQWLDAQRRLDTLRSSAESAAKAPRRAAVDALEDLRRRYWSLRDRISAKLS